MDWRKIEVAEHDAYTPWAIIIAPVLGVISALLIADGCVSNDPGTLIVGAVSASRLAHSCSRDIWARYRQNFWKRLRLQNGAQMLWIS